MSIASHLGLWLNVCTLAWASSYPSKQFELEDATRFQAPQGLEAMRAVSQNIDQLLSDYWEKKTICRLLH